MTYIPHARSHMRAHVRLPIGLNIAGSSSLIELFWSSSRLILQATYVSEAINTSTHQHTPHARIAMCALTAGEWWN